METKALFNFSQVLSELSRAADYADLYLQAGVSHGILFEEGRFDTLSSARSDGLGVRVLRGGNTIYAHTTGTSVASASRALREAAGRAELSGMDRLPGPMMKSSEPLLCAEAPLPSLDAGFFHDLDRILRAECPALRQLTFRYSSSVKSVVILRGDGRVAQDERAYTTFAAQVVLERNGDLQTGYEARSMTLDPAAFWLDERGERIRAEDVARRALARGLLMLDAIPCPAGSMPVVLAGTAGGTMIHEACGHGLEADIIQKDFSVYRDRVGALVANPMVTIVDDATLPGLYGSYRFDDEGTPAGRTVLVEDGILCGYLTDILSARECDLPLTGNGRRESYKHQPIPRMSNTYVCTGKSTFEEVLAQADRGILVKKMGGGEVDPTSGDFVFFVSEGYLIEKGRIGPTVKGATLTGNGPDVLTGIQAVGSDLCFDPGTCGKSGQGVPVSDGQPTLLIGNITVGGSDTDHGCE